MLLFSNRDIFKLNVCQLYTAPGVRNSNATLLPEAGIELRPSGSAASSVVFHASDGLLVIKFAATDAFVPTSRLPNSLRV